MPTHLLQAYTVEQAHMQQVVKSGPGDVRPWSCEPSAERRGCWAAHGEDCMHPVTRVPSDAGLRDHDRGQRIRFCGDTFASNVRVRRPSFCISEFCVSLSSQCGTQARYTRTARVSFSASLWQITPQSTAVRTSGSGKSLAALHGSFMVWRA